MKKIGIKAAGIILITIGVSVLLFFWIDFYYSIFPIPDSIFTNIDKAREKVNIFARDNPDDFEGKKWLCLEETKSSKLFPVFSYKKTLISYHDNIIMVISPSNILRIVLYIGIINYLGLGFITISIFKCLR